MRPAIIFSDIPTCFLQTCQPLLQRVEQQTGAQELELAASAAQQAQSTTPNLNGPPAVSDVTNACAYDPAEAQAALAQGKPPTRKG